MGHLPRLTCSAFLGLGALVLLFGSIRGVSAQNPDTVLVVLGRLRLDSLRSGKTITYYRTADSARANSFHRLHQTLAHFARERVRVDVTTRVGVLGRDDWSRLTGRPYAFPHNFGIPANLIMAATNPPPPEGLDTLLVGVARDLMVLSHEGGHILTWSLMPAPMLDSLRAPDASLSPELRARFARFDGIPEWYWELTAAYIGLAFLHTTHRSAAVAIVNYCDALAALPPVRFRSLDEWFPTMMSARAEGGGPYLQTAEGRRNFGWYQGVVCAMAEHLYRARGIEYLALIRGMVAGSEQPTTSEIVEDMERTAPGLAAILDRLSVTWRAGRAARY